ncbi:MAG TPA: ExeM/NucH family extracellular endonuclease [Anaerolineales bacterium]|nr:ExeM/NucH family extracellular endonuclease [Anaerolineales bacterium]
MSNHLNKMFSTTLIFALMMSVLFAAQPAEAAPPLFANPSTTVFINEIHYDNTGTDTGESVEIAGPAGTDLTGWSIVLYNGSNGAVYDTDPLSGVLTDQQGGYGTTVLTYPANGIQNGAPDGIALVNGTTLVQFLSYEGSFVGVGGAADGVTSTDIGVSQVGTEAVGSSLQLTGAGDNYGDFTWTATTANTFGSPNTGQSFGAGDAAPIVSGTAPSNGATNVAVTANIDVTFSEAVDVSGSWFGISCGTSGAHTAAVSGGPTTFTLDPDADFANSESCTVTVFAAQVSDQDTNDPPDNMESDFAFSFDTVGAAVANDLVINEIDYDQAGTDTAEFVEIRNNDSVSVDLSAYSIQMVNGNAGGAVQYRLFSLPAVNLAAGDYFVLCANNTTVPNCDLDVTPDTDLIQNGAPDAVALLFNGSVIDTVSYEGDTGAPYTEGSGTGLVDSASGTQSISRCPDGSDTDVNNVDFSEHLSTPGSANACTADDAPAVTSTTPTDGASNVALASNIDVTFSENVDVTGSWFSVSCATSGAHTATVSGGPTAFTLNPDTDFVNSELCTVTVLAVQVSDQDVNDPPDNMTADYAFSFTTEGPVCEQTFTPIYNIQGSGSSAAITGTVTTQGVVVGDFQGSTSAQGFYIQDPTGDSDTATSDGIFVFTGSNDTVNAGDLVRVTGFARERFNQTTLNGSNSNSAPVTSIINCGTGSVAATDVLMPFASATDPERYEGMLVRFPQTLVISEYFNYERFGEIVIALPLDGETRPFTGTAIDEPGAPANARTLANSLRRITLDDAVSTQNPEVLRHPNGAPFALDNRFRGGDTVQNAVGVLGFDFSLYRIFPTGPADYTAVNPRPAAPEPVDGNLRVAAMNTLNFFLSPDNIQEPSNAPDDPADNICGPVPSLECRGFDGDQPLEFTRQRDKLLAALAGLDADIIGLNELENTVNVDPLGDPTNGVVAGLNAMPGVGPYAYINTGVIGTDAIRVGLIYRSDVVVPVGDFQLLTSAVDPRFLDTKSRPALAQTFEELATGNRFTVVVNHLKSKGSDCNDVGDPDMGDGQGNCNQTRKAAAQALVDWLATDPTGSGDPDFLIMGDLNSYAQEDPIDAIKAGADDIAGTGDDYTNLISQYQGTYAYSYVFDGQSGYLDHALANSSLASQVTGAVDWHINADEPDLLDYDTTFKPPAQEAIYEPNGYRSSDHDPVIVGLDLLPQCNGLNATIYVGRNGKIVGGPLNGQTYSGLLSGTNGNDVIVGTNNPDTILALNGNDVICSRGGNDAVTGGAGDDTIDSGSGNDLVLGGANNDVIDTGDGNDTAFGDLGNDTINGGAGRDNIFGGNGLDILDGGADRDVVDGGLDADTLAGGSENDNVLGGPGNDALDGGAGTDICSGGPGTDSSSTCEVNISIP